MSASDVCRVQCWVAVSANTNTTCFDILIHEGCTSGEACKPAGVVFGRNKIKEIEADAFLTHFLFEGGGSKGL